MKPINANSIEVKTQNFHDGGDSDCAKVKSAIDIHSFKAIITLFEDENWQNYSNKDRIPWEAIKAVDDGFATSSMLSVMKGRFRFSYLAAMCLAAFDEYNEAVKDGMNENGSSYCKKNVSLGQSKANTISSLGSSLNPLKWLGELDASSRSDVTDVSRWLDETAAFIRLDEYEASIAGDDGNVMKCILYVREEMFECHSLSAFDEYFEEIDRQILYKDGVITENCEGAADCIKKGSICLSVVIAPATQSGGRFNPPKWLCESYASKWLEESVASQRSDKSIDPRWLAQILSTFSRQLMKLTEFFNSHQIWIPWVYLTR